MLRRREVENGETCQDMTYNFEAPSYKAVGTINGQAGPISPLFMGSIASGLVRVLTGDR